MLKNVRTPALVHHNTSTFAFPLLFSLFFFQGRRSKHSGKWWRRGAPQSAAQGNCSSFLPAWVSPLGGLKLELAELQEEDHDLTGSWVRRELKTAKEVSLIPYGSQEKNVYLSRSLLMQKLDDIRQRSRVFVVCLVLLTNVYLEFFIISRSFKKCTSKGVRNLWPPATQKWCLLMHNKAILPETWVVPKDLGIRCGSTLWFA